MKRIAAIFFTRASLALVLLLGCILALTMGLNSLRPVQQSGSSGALLPIGALAALLGWALAESRLRLWSATSLATLAGVLSIALSVGRLFTPLWEMLAALPPLAGQMILILINWLSQKPFSGEGFSAAWETLLLAGNVLTQAAGTLAGRSAAWIVALVTGKTNADPLAAALGWFLIVWFCAAWLGWAARRMNNPLAGIAPAGLLLAAIFNYTAKDPFPLALLLGFGLALMALLHFDFRERGWLKQRLDFPEEIRMDLAVVAIPLVLTLFGLAALTPPLSIRTITDLARRLAQPARPAGEAAAESLGLDQQVIPPTPAVDPLRNGGLPRNHLLGSGPELSERVVMAVAVLTPAWPPPETTPEPGSQPPHYYWRALTYDTYTPMGWYSTYRETTSYPANQSLLPAIPGNMQVIEQEVSAIEDLGGLLYSAGTLVNVDQPYQVSLRNIPPLSANFPVSAMKADLFSLMDLFGTRTEAKIYRATSAVPIYSIEQLRAAPAEYPQWATLGYLQLPDSLPERVRSLALDLTATQPNAYERAAAIEAYLRTIPYTLDVGQPPATRDITDYYLFELQKGYCDYAATAMVVLSRAAGLPARLVIGYAGGIYDAEKGVYVVTEADAHSWAEVFFPGLGWVEFEPTGGRPEIERPDRAAPREIPPYQLPNREAEAGPTLLQRLTGYAILGLMGLVILGAILGVGGITWLWIERRLWVRRPAMEVIVRLYRRMAAQGKQLAPAAPPGDTPFELAAHLEECLLSLGPRFASLPAAIRQLTHLYARAMYSSHPPNDADRQQAIRAWEALRWPLWNARRVERSRRIEKARRKTRPT